MSAFSFVRNRIFIHIIAVNILGLYIFINNTQAQSINPPQINKTLITDQFHTLQSINAIAAVINDEVITCEELVDRFHVIKKYLAAQNTIYLPTYKQLQRTLLEQMIIEQAQMQIAKKNNIIISDEMLDHIMIHVAAQNNFSLTEFFTHIKQKKIDLHTFKENVRKESTLQYLRDQEINNKILVSESEIDNFFEIENNSDHKNENFNLAQILIRIPTNATSEQFMICYQRAKKILNKLKSGADFTKIATIYSNSSDALNGGNLGWRSKEHLPQLFLDAITNLKPGEFSNIIRSDNGFHIIKLIDKHNNIQIKKPIIVKLTHVRHILIKAQPSTSKIRVKNKIQELKQSLKNTTVTFEELAKLYSDDYSSASKGGDLGWIYPGDTRPEFELAMNKLQLNEISEPVESLLGFHLIQVLERKNATASQKWIRNKIHQAIREKKITEETKKWLKKIRNQTYVEYHINDI